MGKTKDYFKLAISNLRKRKLRSWLTMIGIFISIATIFILISLSLGLQGAVEEQFRILGTDKLFIQAKGGFGAPGGTTAAKLNIEDVKVVEKVLGVKQVSYFITGNAKVEYNDQIRYLPVYGIPPEGLSLYEESSGLKIEDGRELQEGDVKKAMLGWSFKYDKIFDRPLRAGSKIKINDVEFKTSGIVDRIGNPQDDKNIILLADEVKEMFDTGDRVDYIFIQVENGQDIKEVTDRIERRLKNFRNVDDKTIDFTILTPEDLLATFKTILSIITGFLGAVAAISLLVGGIGIANTMYTSVLERTREIGVMKAIGARNAEITSIFMIEAGLIGFVGGVIGVILGIAVSKLIEYIAINNLGTTLLRAAIPPYLVFGCIAFAFLIGAISGLLPARHASRINTVEALRYE